MAATFRPAPSALMSTTSTRAPSSASRRAVAPPIPWAPPVTIATRSDKRSIAEFNRIRPGRRRLARLRLAHERWQAFSWPAELLCPEGGFTGPQDRLAAGGIKQVQPSRVEAARHLGVEVDRLHAADAGSHVAGRCLPPHDGLRPQRLHDRHPADQRVRWAVFHV